MSGWNGRMVGGWAGDGSRKGATVMPALVASQPPPPPSLTRSLEHRERKGGGCCGWPGGCGWVGCCRSSPRVHGIVGWRCGCCCLLLEQGGLEAGGDLSLPPPPPPFVSRKEQAAARERLWLFEDPGGEGSPLPLPSLLLARLLTKCGGRDLAQGRV